MTALPVIAHRIGGKVVDDAQRRIDVTNPATGEVTAAVALASDEHVDLAVTTARTAFESWRDTSLARRQQILFAYRELLREHIGDIARVITAEHGKTLPDASGEIARGIEVVEYASAVPAVLKGEFSEQVSTGIDTHSVRQPLGVCAGITPFNFPAMVPLWMFPVAIAAGNTFVLKPSERDPSTSLLLAELFEEAGLPDGVLNVVQGDREAVTAILEHPEVAAVSFVGSTPVAKYIYETAARNGKRVQALGGAKNHMVVLPDADMDLAADAVTSAAYGSAGQRCMAISALVTVGDAADRLVPRVVEQVRSLVVGDGADPTSDMGPVITRDQRDRVASYVESGQAAGADVLIDGRSEGVPESATGFFIGPSLLDRVTVDMDVYRDEIFGPLLSIVRTDSLQEAITLVNANPYANGAAIFTNDGGAARRFQRDIDAGMVGVNIPIPVPMSFYSFGGAKASMFGSSHVYGPEGLQFYTRAKVVTTRWPAMREGHLDLGFARP